MNTLNFTFNFNAPVGQNIAHVDKLEAHFDKDMTMQVIDGAVENHPEVSEAPSPWERDGERPPLFILHGSGWGHGVGLCQIGAAVMGAKGYNYKEILHHYYPEASLTEWYTPSPQCPSRDDC